VNSSETVLTPTNVTVGSFGKDYSVAVDGNVYAEPLVETGVSITAGGNTAAGAVGTHDVVYVETENDSIYAFDTTAGTLLWKRTFLDTTSADVGTTPGTDINNTLGATSIIPIPAVDTNSTDITPEVGITSTPVIDTAYNCMFVTAVTKETINGVADWVQRVHAISLSNGTDVVAPWLIAATPPSGDSNTPIYVYGDGDSSVTDPYNGTGKPVVQFNALRENQRSALQISDNVLYISWSSHGNQQPYHGWIIGLNIANLTTSNFVLTGVFCDTPNGAEGGIWEGGGSIVFDPNGTTFYVATGNGNGAAVTYDANGFPVDGNYSQSVVKLVPDSTTAPTNQSLNGWGFKVADFFTPYNRLALDAGDSDLGSGGLLMLPTGTVAGYPDVMLAAGKTGTIYVINRDNMGKFDPNNDHVLNAMPNGQGNNVGQTLMPAGSYGTPSYFNGTIYWVTGQHGPEYAFQVSSSGIVTQTSITTEDNLGYVPGSPFISSNGTSNGIVWQIDRNTGVLRAISASNLNGELWNSGQAANGADALDSTTKFAPVTVANGLVFVGTQDDLTVYGLLTPSKLTDANIGNPGVAGSANYANGTWTVTGGGTDVWGTSDQFNFAYEPITGDNTVIARISSLTGTSDGAYASAGVMIRDGTAANAPFAFVISGVNGADFKYRTSAGAAAAESGWKNTQTPVYWVKLVRVGNTFTAYTAPDVSGSPGLWTQIGATQTIAMTNPTVGLAVTANNNAASATAAFTNFSVTATTGGLTDADIGSPGDSGSASLSNGIWTVSGGGADVWYSSDQFNYAYQNISGDVTVVARVNSITGSGIGAYASAGVMIRGGAAANAPFAYIISGSNGADFKYRTSAGTPAAESGWITTDKPVYWVELVRSGNVFTAYAAPDVNGSPGTWSEIGSPETISMTTPEAGMAVDADNNSALATAMFSNFSITPTNGGLIDTDIGSPSDAGSASYTGGVYTVSGGGSDVWFTSDQFNYDYELLSGTSNTVIARVSSLTGTSAGAYDSAGVMIRGGTAANAPFAFVISGANGADFKYRTSAGASAAESGWNTTETPVYWVKLVQSGNTYTAYTAPDVSGSPGTWTQLGTTQTITMTGATVGLAVTADNNAGIATATFSNFSVTATNGGLVDTDIGSPGDAGSAGYSNGVYTVSGGGSDVYYASDQFNYDYQTLTGTSNTVVARVTSLTGSGIGAYASAGVMIRDGTAANAAFAFIISGSNGADFKYRTSTGATAAESGWKTTEKPIYWVELVQSGSTFTAYTAPDVSGSPGTWTQLGTTQTIAMTNPTAGLAVTADNNSALATATFSNFSVTPTTNGAAALLNQLSSKVALG